MVKSVFVAGFLAVTALISGCAADAEDTSTVPDVTLDPNAVNLKGGARAKPVFTNNGLSLSSTAAVSGLGNADVTINLLAIGIPHATCTNPAGQTQPPGQNPVEVALTGLQVIPANAIKNGNVTFNVTSGAPAEYVPGAVDCPNSHWTERVDDVAFTSATITVAQSGATVLTLNCTFSPPTVNGVVSSQTVTCTK